MYSLPLQREFHRQVPSYFIKDDHDILKDDCWPGQTQGELSFARGVELFAEQTPSSRAPYRRFRWGAQLELWLLEGREFRSPNTDPDGPEKTILGPEQLAWLERTLVESDATFRVVLSATPIVGPDRSRKAEREEPLAGACMPSRPSAADESPGIGWFSGSPLLTPRRGAADEEQCGRMPSTHTRRARASRCATVRSSGAWSAAERSTRVMGSIGSGSGIS